MYTPVHPSSVAVGAFKVVVELESKRRENDKKVNLLFLEMRNMMSALLQWVTCFAPPCPLLIIELICDT